MHFLKKNTVFFQLNSLNSSKINSSVTKVISDWTILYL